MPYKSKIQPLPYSLHQQLDITSWKATFTHKNSPDVRPKKTGLISDSETYKLR